MERRLTFARIRLFRVCCIIVHWDLFLSTTSTGRLLIKVSINCTSFGIGFPIFFLFHLSWSFDHGSFLFLFVALFVVKVWICIRFLKVIRFRLQFLKIPALLNTKLNNCWEIDKIKPKYLRCFIFIREYSMRSTVFTVFIDW